MRSIYVVEALIFGVVLRSRGATVCIYDLVVLGLKKRANMNQENATAVDGAGHIVFCLVSFFFFLLRFSFSFPSSLQVVWCAGLHVLSPSH